MRALLPILLFAAAAPALAADDDAAALSLADQTAKTTQAASDWSTFVEAAAARSALRGGGSEHDANLFLGVRYDTTFAPGWRAIFADLLDARWQEHPSSQKTLNTIIDAYVSWQMRPNAIIDAGRINTHNGVAFGYNPTDYFRANAVRSVISVDPASLRENRLGSVMIRSQALWAEGALTALYSPKLADQPSNSAFSPDFGATNFRDRWLLAASYALSKQINPQFLIYGEAGQSPQIGLNVTTLLSDATVAYVEYSGGRASSLLAQVQMPPSDSAFLSRLAAGATYTTAGNLSLTIEYEYNGAGLGRAAWNALRSGSPAVYAQYRTLAAELQELPTKQRVFANARWQDAMINHLDLAAFAYYDCVDSSRQAWVEARYHWTKLDLALQWQVNSGSPGSEYGALPARQTWQALVKYFF
jgi:opacity protein-like surface antigen